MTPEQVRIFKAMSPGRKLDLAAQFYFGARRLKARGLQAQHPDWPEAKVLARVRELFLYAAD